MADPILRQRVAPRQVDDAELEREMFELEGAEAPFPEYRHCRECGCTDDDACEGGCEWVEDDLCSRCAEV